MSSGQCKQQQQQIIIMEIILLYYDEIRMFLRPPSPAMNKITQNFNCHTTLKISLNAKSYKMFIMIIT